MEVIDVQALVADGRGGVRVEEVRDPDVSLGQVLVRVRACSVNRGEAMGLSDASSGERVGWDFAGEVLEAPGEEWAVGERVCGLTRDGSWAQRIVVAADAVGRLPDAVADGAGAAFALAGLTARWALDRGGTLAGRVVLVSGASGGVGRLAVQLARRAGAEVVAVARPSHAVELERLGASHVVASPAECEQAHLVLESVGGPSLAAALELVAPDGVVVSFGSSSEQPSAVPPFWFGGHAAARLEGFVVFTEAARRPAGPALSELAELVARGELDPGVGEEVTWTQAPALVEALLARRLAGKGVLRVA